MKADYVHKDSKTSTDETISYKITMPLIDTEELQRENQELKKQIENKENQQKKFIEYLEKEIYNLDDFMKNIETSNRCHGDYPVTYYIAQYKLQKSKEILSKYKEIIGDKDE